MKHTKFLVISDIHGSLSGALLAKEAYTHHHCDCILNLGDNLYHGPRNDLPEDYQPKKVIEILNSLQDVITAVRGNCDAEVDQMVLSYPLMDTSKTLFTEKRTLFLTHGHVIAPDHIPSFLKEGDVFLSGHTHIPTAHSVNGIFLLNPGSASLPKENHPKSYGILDDNGFVIYTSSHEEYMRIEF